MGITRYPWQHHDLQQPREDIRQSPYPCYLGYDDGDSRGFGRKSITHVAVSRSQNPIAWNGRRGRIGKGLSRSEKFRKLRRSPHSAVWIDPKARFLVGWTPCPAQPYLSGMGRTLGDLMASRYVVEHLHHLGIVAEVCREIGVANWLDQQEPGNRQQVSVGTATVAMVLNGLGFSNRQLYLVPQFFANKPVEHLLGAGITAEMLNDDCLGRTLDWLYAHDLTKLFAGIANQARRIFGIKAEQVHVDTTSFPVSGDYTRAEGTAEPAVIPITYGYSRDHRYNLNQR